MLTRIGECWLRDWREEDAPALARHADNREIWRNLRDAFPHPCRPEHARDYIRRVSGARPRTVFALAEPYATNAASARVLEKAGFRLEGRMRANAFKGGKVLDQLLYAVVRE